jgi:hypothetical protein
MDTTKQAFIYTVSGEILPILPMNGVEFGLKEMQEIVGGYLQIVHLKDGRLMVINEEGKMDHLDYNEQATHLYNNQYDFIVGDVIVTPACFIK